MAGPILKFALIGGGFGAGAVGIYYVTAGMTERLSFLSEDEEFKKESNDYKTKWGEKYAHYLISSKGNKSWWDQKFKELGNNKPSTGKFKNVDKAEEGDNSLKNICDGAYKADSSKVKSDNAGDEDFAEADIWKYCSPSGTKIETLKDQTSGATTYSNGQYGNSDNNKGILVYAGDANKNKWFWDLKEEELKTANNLNGESIFKKLQDKLLNKGTSDQTVKSTLRETCSDTYSKTENESGAIKYPKLEVFKFCSLTGKEPASGGNA